MSARLDAATLDQVWDAHVLGTPSPSPVEDTGERTVFALLDECEQPEPNPIFAHSLARTLNIEAASNARIPVPAVPGPQDRTPRTRYARTDPWSRPPSRWMGAGSALAAIALLIAISAFAIIYQRADDAEGPSIPAVSDWNNDGTADAPGDTANTLAAQTLAVEELEEYWISTWSWIGLTRGTIAPGETPAIVSGSLVAGDPGYSGIGAIAVEGGTLAALVDAGAWVQRGQGVAREPIDRRTTVTLNAGDALFAPPSALSELWNPGEIDAVYLAGGVYTAGSRYPFDDAATGNLRGGTQIDPYDLAIDEPLTLTLDHVALGPSETYPYTISSETWLLAMVAGTGLQMQERFADGTSGNARTLDPSVHSLHQDRSGEYELINVSSKSVDVYLFRVEPVPQSVLTTQFDTLVDFTLLPEQLQEYRFDDWRWIQFNRNSVAPQGDSTTFEQLKIPGWNVIPGMNLMSIESGELIVAPESDVLVGSGASGAFEPEPGGSEIRLSAGDSLLYQSGTEGRFWNPTDIETMVVGGGGYLRPNFPNFGTVNTWTENPGQFGHGTTITRGDMPGSGPVSFAIERVSIIPDGRVMIDLDPGIWTVVTLERGDLLQTTFLQGVQAGESVSVLQGEMTLRFEEGKTVELRNVGANAAVIYVLRVEPVESDNIS